jgi:hypothetical protein
MKSVSRFIPLTLVSLLPLLVAGCAAKRVSAVYTPLAAGASVGAGAIRSYASFTDIKEGYRIHGMISAEILYGAKWSKDSAADSKKEAEKQDALLREAAAGLGVNSLVGLTSLKDLDVDTMRSCAILVNTGVQPSENEPARPRFIVCVLPVKVKVETARTNLASRLEPFLTPELQFHLAQKGYYTYRCNSTRGDVTGLAVEKEIPAELREPLGVVPDFVLTCEIDEGPLGLDVKALRMHVAMYDVQKKVIVWEAEESLAAWSLLDLVIDPKGKWTVISDVHKAVNYAVVRLSRVSGFGKLKK